MCFPIWELLLCLFLQTPLTIQSLSVTPPPPVSNTQAVPWFSGAQHSQSPWDRPRLMHKNSHKEPEKHCRSPISGQLRLPRPAAPHPASQAAPGLSHGSLAAKSSSLSLPQPRARQDPALLSHKHSPALPQLHGSQKEQPLPAWANSGIFLSPTDSQKSSIEPGMCQPPHPPRSHSASWHWEISHSLSSHALSLFPSPSSLEKKSLGQRPSLSVQSQALYGPDHNNKVYSRNNTNTEFYQPKPRVSQINS